MKILLWTILALWVMLAHFIVMETPVYSQTQKKKFEVFYNGNKVGTMLVSKANYGSISEIKLNVNADLRMMMIKIHLDGLEEAIFENGVLNYSSVIRKVNGKIKTNKQSKKDGKTYFAYDGTVGKALDITEIRHNTLSILFNQPVDGQKIYVDHLQQAHQIHQTSSNVYRVALRDGNFNQYTYHNGECSLIELNTNLVKLVFKQV